MKRGFEAQKEIERLNEARVYGSSRIGQIEEDRRVEEEVENRLASKRENIDEIDGFIDNRDEDRKSRRIKQEKRGPRGDDDDYEDRPPTNDYNQNDIIGALKNVKVASASTKQKKVNEKDNAKSKEMMNDLFEELENDDTPLPGFSKPQPRSQNTYVEPRSFVNNLMDEEAIPQTRDVGPAIAGLDDELEALEADYRHQTNGNGSTQKPTHFSKMDVERPSANQASAVRPAQMQPSSVDRGFKDDKSFESFMKSLYCRSKHRYMDFTSKHQEDRKVEVETFENKAHFYYIDVQEDTRRDKGQLFVYGKIKTKDRGVASCCIAIKDMERTFYIFKRDNESCKIDDALTEVRNKIEKRHPNLAKANLKYEIVTNKYYNFELDIARGNVQCIKVTYSFAHQPLDIDFEGINYNGIIGSTYKSTELFLIENRIMGPSWLEVSDFKISAQKEFSHCDIELTVESRYDTIPLPNQPDPPKLKAMSVSLIRDKDGNNDIKVIAGLYIPNYDVENIQTTVNSVPYAFVAMADINKEKRDYVKRVFGDNVTFQKTDYAMIQAFLQNLARLDPDIMIGHDVNNVFYEALLTRIDTIKIDLTSNFSRSKRDTAEMKRALRTFGLKKIRNATIGRMVCDTHLSSAEIIRETNYELDYLAEKHLNENNIYSFRTTSKDQTEALLRMLDEALMNCHLSLSLCQKLQLIQLNKQLTNVSGCFWYQSFQNLRAERNEMLLMHTFYRNDFIFPDKYTQKYDEEAKKKAKKREKPKFVGGLVLEPKAGLYQDFILLLDFNSLYPSIIREFKICFTTVKRDFVTIEYYKPKEKEKNAMDVEEQEDGDDEEDQDAIGNIRIPDHDHLSVKDDNKNGILPKIVHNLILKRKEIKNQMKNAKDTVAQETLDVKQKAVKLIANSIYGCLGYKSSRFYAKQMAALITNYGRNILASSSQKVTELGFEVIYGDTDSLMINSREKELGTAIKKGLEIKKVINQTYKSKGILEIEVDGIFRRLLLLKKKKYAADKLTNLDEIMKNLTDTSIAKFSVELKGLDIVRRDWSGLTKSSGEHLVRLILSCDKDSDEVVMLIKEYVARLKSDLDTNKIPIDSFTIYKQLNKSPEQYKEKGQPHVVVAKKMLLRGYKNEQLLHHFIPYIICKLISNN